MTENLSSSKHPSSCSEDERRSISVEFINEESDLETEHSEKEQQAGPGETLFSPDVYRIYHKIPFTNPSLSISCFKSDFDDGLFIWHADSSSDSNKPLSISLSVAKSFKPMQKYEQRTSEKLQNVTNLSKCSVELKASSIISSQANRISVIKNSNRYLAAAYLENGNVEIFSTALRKLDRDKCKIKPASIAAGRCEGFALGWCSNSEKFAFGDKKGTIYISDIERSGKLASNDLKIKEKCHSSSIEDIHWINGSEFVFGSCSVDRNLKIWDTRCDFDKGAVQEVTKLHSSDINVFSINPINKNIVISGDNNGNLTLSDIRKYKSGVLSQNGSNSDKPTSLGNPIIKLFKWHNSPISSVRWNPHKEFEFLAASLDDTVTLWEINSNLIEYRPPSKKNKLNEKDSHEPPDEIYFDHRGVNQPREAHWIDEDGIICTDIAGVDIFYPLNE